MIPAPDRREEPATDAGELAMVTGWLDYHRATLQWKCSELRDDQLKQRAVPPSSLTLLGLLRHMAEVERGWFREALAGERPVRRYYTDARPDDDWDDLDSAPVEEVFADWQAECSNARGLVASSSSLDALGRGRGGRFTLRWILTHMVEEYARHNGHADLLRERIDGATGD
jgi:uncharacterized damage-inducible protein DinB